MLALLCFIPGHSPASDQAAVRPALVQLQGGSGVCVSPDGWIVTAAHMLPGWPFTNQPPGRRHNVWLPTPAPAPPNRPPASVPVRLSNGEQMEAKVCVVRDADKGTDLAVLKVNGNNLPFRPLATRAPAVGEACTACGFPAGNWYWNECRIIGMEPFVISTDGRQEQLDMIETNHLSAGGASGGPLLNQRGEVIGICSRSSIDSRAQRTFFARWDHMTSCLLEAGYSPLSSVASSEPTLIVWTSAKCGPCAQFKADFAAGIDCNGKLLHQAFRVQICDIDQSPDLARKLGVSSVPAFVVDGGEPIYGYSGPQWLAQQLVRYQFPIVPKPADVVVPPPSATVPPPPPEKPEAPPAEKEKAEATPLNDPTAVRVLLLFKRRGSLGSFDWLKGIALSRLERRAERDLPPAVRAVLGDKVQADLVFERTNPTRYEELATTAGANAQINAVVLVAKRFNGVASRLADFVASKLQALASSHGETIDVDLVFERTAAERYHAVIEALGEPEPLSDELLAAGAAAGTATGGVWAWFRRRKRPA